VITGKRSATRAGSEYYKRSARYFRRQNRATSQAVCVPSILGPNTAVIAALCAGPRRRANLQMLFHERILQSLRKNDAAGVTTDWQLPNLKPGKGLQIGKGRARRGICVALNPAFPFVAEVRKLATSIAKTYDVTIDGDLHPHKLADLPSNPDVDIYRLCGSAVKTKTLLTLECLRGSARSHTLYHCVPDKPLSGVKGMVRSLVALGIVTNVDGTVAFAATPWRSDLRRLLRAFLAHEPQFVAAVRREQRQKNERTRGYQRYGLFGKNAAVRLLSTLSAHGPLTRSKLEARAGLGTDWQLLERLAGMGIVTRTGKQRLSRYALNAAHPLYAPLRRYFLALQGLTLRSAPRETVATRLPKYSAETLFGTQLQLDVLVMLYLSGDDGIDGSDLRRLLPQHNTTNMRHKLWDFIRWGLAIEDDPDYGVIRYRLNREFPNLEPLTKLLDAVLAMYPHYERAYGLRETLWPVNRATRERNRARSRVSMNRL